MSIKISYSNRAINKSPANLVLFTDEKFNINSLKTYISNAEFSYINDLLKTSDFKKNMFVYELNSKK
jgi:leucyl aminopeptidase